MAIFSIKSAEAEETTSTTFPVDEAGIAVYVKADNIEDIDIDALAEALYSVEKQGESYVIGTVEIANEVGFNYPHLYVGLDGWLVAYYLKTEETSKIMQWKGYTPGSINTTTLKDAIDYISAKTGITFLAPIKYYDFEFPEANKMTLVVDSNDFYATVPGTLYEASYQVILRTPCCSGFMPKCLRLKVDDDGIFEACGGSWFTCWGPTSPYGYYNPSIFETEVTHHVIFNDECGNAAYVTVLLYKN